MRGQRRFRSRSVAGVPGLSQRHASDLQRDSAERLDPLLGALQARPQRGRNRFQQLGLMGQVRGFKVAQDQASTGFGNAPFNVIGMNEPVAAIGGFRQPADLNSAG